MPQKKAHWLHPDQPPTERDGEWFVTAMDVDDNYRPYGDTFQLPISSLTQTDAYKVAGSIGINPKGFATNESRIEGIIRHLETRRAVWNVTNKRVLNETPAPAPMPEPAPRWTPEPAPMPEPKKESPAKVVESPPDAAADLVGALGRMVTDLAGKSIDETKVRAIVADAVKDLAPRITRIELPNMTEVEIEGLQHHKFARVLTLAARRHNVWLSGPAGTGKSHMAKQAAEVLCLPYYEMSCDVTVQRATLLGFRNVTTGEPVVTDYERAYGTGGVFLLDEIDKGTPGVLAGLNQSLANGSCGFASGSVKRHPDFIFIGTANTFGTGATDQYVGSLKIDAATLDRFHKVHVGIDEELEEHVVRTHIVDRVQADTWLGMVRTARQNVDKAGLRVLVTPRAAIQGAIDIAAGDNPRDVAEELWLAGLSADDRRKVGA